MAEAPKTAASKPAAKDEPKAVTLVANTPLLEPHTMVKFPMGVKVEVEELTSWLQCQIDAGLLEVV